VFPLAQERYGFLLGDFAGLDAEAAAHAMLMKTVLRLRLAQHMSPAEALTDINRFLLPRLAPESLATVFLDILETDKSELVYASAGHEPPILFTERAVRPLPLGMGI
jgi:sigma-B regulation protein RsbU (phosphoserine phosphatase)